MDSNSNSISDRGKRIVNEEHVDRISGLPDDILGKILSQIPTKEAVRTSVVSKRWRNVWTSISMLNFNDRSLYYLYCDVRGPTFENPNYFRGFIDRVILLCDSSIMYKFSLNVSEIYNFPYVCDWISAAVAKFKIPVMNISLGVDEDYKYDMMKSRCFGDLPENMFNSEALISLEVRWWYFSLEFPKSFNLPNLKVLEISMFNPCLDFTKHLFSSCPRLERLKLYIHMRCLDEDFDGFYEDPQNLVVSSTSLREMQVFWTTELPDIDYYLEHYHIVEINCPNLVYLDVHDGVVAHYAGEELPELVVANIDFGAECICSYHREEGDLEEDTQFFRVLNLFKNIASVKTLCLSHAAVFMLDLLDVIHLPMFYNLTKLDMEYSNCIDMESILSIVGTAPNLVDLILNKIHRQPTDQAIPTYDRPAPEPPHRLERIQIWGVHNIAKDFLVVEYFLKKGIVLKNMKLCAQDKMVQKQVIYGDMYDIYDMFEETDLPSEIGLDFRAAILEIPKASKDCVIEFDGDFSD